MTYTVRLDEIGKDDLALAGGKGANLGELSRAGLPVPPGFVVTTGAYDAFVEASGLRGDRRPRLTTRDGGCERVRRSGREIRALFSGGEVPAELAQEIESAYGELGESPVAVRSSATAEDLAGASFAGQQETYLNVRGMGALIGAIKDCWASCGRPGRWHTGAPGHRRGGREPRGGRTEDGGVSGGGSAVHR